MKMETILSHFKDSAHQFIVSEHICIDFSANSAVILVEYSYLHVLCTHGCFV